MTRALMFQGTGSDVGKTILVAGLCRAAFKRGIRVAPFKPQNMSNNAAVAKADEGEGEIGRGQWLQALACNITPSVHMNPVLLKPQSQVGSQVVLQGKVFGQSRAREYQALKPRLLDAVLDSYRRVCADADLVIVEGAGSPSEINLRDGDIANMGFAVETRTPVVLIGDVDRGGVIASIVGTHKVLSDEDRNLIVGYLINKFRGDVTLFDDAIDIISGFTGWHSFGILPWIDLVRRMPSEDSVVLDRPSDEVPDGFCVAVPAMSKVANFDDLDPLRNEPGVDLKFLRKGDPFPEAVDLVVLPGSKSTIADLAELRENGWEQPIKDHAKQGGAIIDLCGGYQMLGKEVRDPDGIEGDLKQIAGIGLLDVETVLIPEKIVRNSAPRSVEYGCALDGYEIHMGRTTGADCERPMITTGEYTDGAISENGRVQGCYLHGLFASDAFRRAYLASLGLKTSGKSHREELLTTLDELALAIEDHLDVDGLLAAAKTVPS